MSAEGGACRGEQMLLADGEREKKERGEGGERDAVEKTGGDSGSMGEEGLACEKVKKQK